MVLNDKITFREIDNSILIITPWDNSMHVIENVGKDILNLIIEKKEKNEIVEEIVNIYDISESIARDDIDSFIDDLVKKDILI